MRMISSAGSEILLDAPTLFEAKMDMLCGKIVSVVANAEVCAKRISLRDNISEGQAKARLSAQHNERFFRDKSDFVIENNSDGLSSKIDKIIEAIRNNQ